MKILFRDDIVRAQCTGLKAALKLFGGDRKMAVSLLARIYAIETADVIKDIILTPTFRFHALKGGFSGFFAMDVKSSRDKWRIILQPLDENEKPFVPCHIDEIAAIVRIVEIREVSSHYE